MSLLAQDQIYDPAAPDVNPRASAVPQDGGVLAPGLLQGIGQHRKSLKGSVIVDALGEGQNFGCLPRRVKKMGMEGIANDFPYKLCLGLCLLKGVCLWGTRSDGPSGF